MEFSTMHHFHCDHEKSKYSIHFSLYVCQKVFTYIVERNKNKLNYIMKKDNLNIGYKNNFVPNAENIHYMLKIYTHVSHKICS